LNGRDSCFGFWNPNGSTRYLTFPIRLAKNFPSPVPSPLDRSINLMF